MFICEECHTVQPPRVKPILKVISTREVHYVNNDGDVSKGFEVVKEIKVCKECHETTNPSQGR